MQPDFPFRCREERVNVPVEPLHNDASITCWARKRANLDVLWILPLKEYLLKPLSDCSTFTFGHFVILHGGVRAKKQNKERRESWKQANK